MSLDWHGISFFWLSKQALTVSAILWLALGAARLNFLSGSKLSWPGKAVAESFLYFRNNILMCQMVSSIYTCKFVNLPVPLKCKQKYIPFNPNKPEHLKYRGRGQEGTAVISRHCKYIQSNFYTFYRCPTFHCIPTVFYCIPCCSKHSGINVTLIYNGLL